MTDVGQDTETTVTRKAVAKHYLLNAAAEVVEDEKDATGIRYVQISTGQTFDYQVSQAAMLMLATFGAKTLATNEASQSRNNPKGAGSDQEQMEAIRNRFALLDQGEWVDRTRTPGALVDKDTLAEAVVLVMIEDQKITEDQKADAVVKVRAKLEADANYLTTVRQHPRVTANYAKLKGRVVKTTDDLMSALG